MNSALAKLKAFFAAAPDAIAGYLNVAEVKRVALTAALTGATAWGILGAVVTTPTVYTDPELGSALVALAVAAVEVYRRLRHENLGRVAN